MEKEGEREKGVDGWGGGKGQGGGVRVEVDYYF